MCVSSSLWLSDFLGCVESIDLSRGESGGVTAADDDDGDDGDDVGDARRDACIFIGKSRDHDARSGRPVSDADAKMSGCLIFFSSV